MNEREKGPRVPRYGMTEFGFAGGALLSSNREPLNPSSEA